MKALRAGLLIFGGIAAVIALFGLTTVNMTLYAVAGIAAALAGIAWGLVVALQDSEVD